MSCLERLERAALLAGLALAPVLAVGEQVRATAVEEDALKSAVVSRVAYSLDPALPVALGKTAVRQAALLRARELLASGRRVGLDEGWNVEAPEWQQAEAGLIQSAARLTDQKIESSEWLYAVPGREIGRILNAEEADCIASHFTAVAGNEQRILLETRLIGEVLMTNYTVTNRIDINVPGLKDDFDELSSAYWEPEPFRKPDFMNDPKA
jgi:hypothetical protein